RHHAHIILAEMVVLRPRHGCVMWLGWQSMQRAISSLRTTAMVVSVGLCPMALSRQSQAMELGDSSISRILALCCSQTNQTKSNGRSKVIKATLLVSLLVAPLAAQQSNQLSTQTIAAAVLPLPETLRNSATVVRLNDSSQPEVLRKGTNGMVCIA